MKISFQVFKIFLFKEGFSKFSRSPLQAFIFFGSSFPRSLL